MVVGNVGCFLSPLCKDMESVCTHLVIDGIRFTTVVEIERGSFNIGNA